MSVPKQRVVEEAPGGVTEAAKFKWWRTRIVKLTMPELAYKLGYSERQLARYELGVSQHGKLLRAQTWRRFRMACARLAHKSPTTFDWGA